MRNERCTELPMKRFRESGEPGKSVGENPSETPPGGSVLRGAGIPALLLTLAFAVQTSAQKNPQPAAAPVPLPAQVLPANLQPREEPRESMPALVQASGPVMALFQRAEEGVARRDWKLAVDSLQRIIEETEGSLLPGPGRTMPGGSLYESSRRQAMRALGTLPPEGIAAYRLLHDGTARGLLERGIADHDAASLRVVMERYLLSSYGDDAADALSSFAVDEGRASEALAILDEAQLFVPEGDVPRERVAAKRIAAQGILGQHSRALAAYEDLATAMSAAGGDRDWFEEVRPFTQPSETERLRWNSPSGRSGDNGGPLRPTLSEDVPWRFALRASRPAWEEFRDPSSGDGIRAPIVNLVVDRHRVHVRTATGCASLDASDLTPVWKAPPLDSESELRARAAALVKNRSAGAASGPNSDRFVTETVVAAGGLVFTVERGEDPVRVAQRMQPIVMGMRPPADPTTVELNITYLTAYDAVTGQERWHTDLSSGASEAMRVVELRGGPLEVEGKLWMYVWRAGEQSIMVLNPRDGSMEDEIVLYVGSNSARARRSIQDLAFSDGIVYVPTDAGFLFAVEARTRTIRWAAQYPSTNLFGSLRWFPSPPVVRGGLVLLFASDRADVSAISADDGSFRWSVDPPGVVQVVGADHESIWLSGNQVVCLALAKGTEKWRVELPGFNDGGATMGDGYLYVPTHDTLLSIDSRIGEIVARWPIPVSERPIGSLYFGDHSLFAINGAEVRKLPDVERLYAVARPGGNVKSTNARAVSQLAWLELFRGQPQRALDALEPIDTGTSESAESPLTSAVRVRAMLKLAEQELGTPQAVETLARAASLAQRPVDRIRCEVEWARGLVAVGKRAEAYERLWQLGVSRSGESMIGLPDGCMAPARVEISRHLAELYPTLPAQDQDRARNLVDQFVQEQVRLVRSERTAPREALRILQATAELAIAGWSRQVALLALAENAARGSQLEQAEQYLMRCVRADLEPTLTATALMRLGDLYMSSAFRIPFAARSVLDDLESRFSQIPIPPDSVGLDTSEPTVADWIAGVRQTLAAGEAETAEPPDLGNGFSLVGLAARGGPSQRLETARLVNFLGGRPGIVHHRLFVHDGLFGVRALHAGSLEGLWETELSMPVGVSGFEHADGRANRAAQQRTMQATDKVDRLFAAFDGQTAVFAGPDLVLGVGLVTGKRLWAVKREPGDARGYPNGILPMAAGDGLAVFPMGVDRLAAVRMIDGTVVWERPLHGSPISQLYILNRTVVAVERFRHDLYLFSLDDGRIRGQFPIGASAGKMENLLIHEGLAIGRNETAGDGSLFAIHVESATVAWTQSFSDRFMTLFELSPGSIGVGFVNGDMIILDSQTGAETGKVRVAESRSVMDATMVGGVLVARHSEPTAPWMTVRLTGLDAATGDVLWNRADVAPVARCNWPLRVAGGLIPICVEGTERRPGGHPPVLSLALLDPRTGANVGTQVTLAIQQGRSGEQIEGWEQWPGWLVFDSREKMIPVRIQADKSASSGS